MKVPATPVILLSGLLSGLLAIPATAQDLETIAKKTAGMKAQPGFFTFYRDDVAGRVYLAIDRFGADFLYVNSLPSGVGSNDIGLDRGKIGSTKLVVAFGYGTYRSTRGAAETFDRAFGLGHGRLGLEFRG